MKTKYLLMLLFGGLVTPIFAQKIEYDFKKQKYEEIPKLRFNSDVVFCIKNINGFVYQANIDSQKWNLITDIPAELQTLFRLKSEVGVAGKETEKAVESMIELKKTNESVEMKQLVNDCVKYQEAVKNVQKQVDNYDELLSLTQEETVDQEQLKSK